MRVAALYDIHGNLPALEAVLEEVADLGVDRIVVGGDVLPGPMPRGCLEALRALETPADYVRGNGDREVVAFRRGKVGPAVSEAFHEVMYWCGDRLTDDDAHWIASWPLTVTLHVEGVGRVLFCHATPRDDNEIFTVDTPAERVEPALESVDADIVVCGHTHMQFERSVDGRRVVNAGSVGMPFGSPGAYWLLLDGDIELRRTRYDLTAAAARVRHTEYPMGEVFADENILSPPAEEFMRSAFEKAALGAPQNR